MDQRKRKREGKQEGKKKKWNLNVTFSIPVEYEISDNVLSEIEMKDYFKVNFLEDDFKESMRKITKKKEDILLAQEIIGKFICEKYVPKKTVKVVDIFVHQFHSGKYALDLWYKASIEIFICLDGTYYSYDINIDIKHDLDIQIKDAVFTTKTRFRINDEFIRNVYKEKRLTENFDEDEAWCDYKEMTASLCINFLDLKGKTQLVELIRESFSRDSVFD